VQQGDRSAFDLLVVKYQHKILKLIMRYVRDSSEALDVAQEAFLKAYRAAPSFRGDSAFYTWLYRIAINTAKNHLVAAGRRPTHYNLDTQDPDPTVRGVADDHRCLTHCTQVRTLVMSKTSHVRFKKMVGFPLSPQIMNESFC